MELQELKGRNAEIYQEYLNSCIVKNNSTKNITSRKLLQKIEKINC